MTGAILQAQHAEGSSSAAAPAGLGCDQQVLVAKADEVQVVAQRGAVQPEQAAIRVQAADVVVPARAGASNCALQVLHARRCGLAAEGLACQPGTSFRQA